MVFASNRAIIIILFGLFFLVNTAFVLERYEIDPAHSDVGFSVEHMAITKVKGRFKDFRVTLMFQEKDLANAYVHAVIQAVSIDKDIKERDDHLRSPDFCDVSKYPTITFKSDQHSHDV